MKKSYFFFLTMLIILLFIIKLSTSGASAQGGCYYDGNEFCLNQEDIMSVDLLPGSFLLMDPTAKGDKHLEEYNNVTVDGSMDRAIDEMDFHRKRMNEYLCHGFVAEEIFREMKSIRVKRRPDDRSSLINSLPDFFGDPNVANDNDYDANDIGTSTDFENLTVQHKLLSDEGSTKYKDWLQRTTTLDDVYRHYAPRKKLRKNNGFRHPTNPPIPNEGTIDEFDGEVTGYAMPAPVNSDKTGSYYYDSPDDHMMPSSSGHSYYPHAPPDLMPIIHEEHYYAPPSHAEEEEYWPKSYGKSGKGYGLSVKDFFELALTALAFLAFGLFIIQMMMNISNTNTTPMPVTMMPEIEGSRFKRSSSKSPYAGNEQLNELSHRVLRSIEAAMVAERDSGKCLRWSLCTDNRYSRSANGTQKILLPMWSLGMSWVSGRMLNKRTWPAMMESVKASIIGLGGADCSSIYPNCDLPRERVKRRRRRRK